MELKQIEKGGFRKIDALPVHNLMNIFEASNILLLSFRAD